VIASRGVAMPTVLLVEDEFLIRDMLQEELEDAGYQVVPVCDADHAIRVLEARQDIHLVFTDINMPGSMDGLKLAAFVNDRWPPVHIIVTTGRANPLVCRLMRCSSRSPIWGAMSSRRCEHLRICGEGSRQGRQASEIQADSLTKLSIVSIASSQVSSVAEPSASS
jgi:two-component system, response regulator PdtaR